MEKSLPHIGAPHQFVAQCAGEIMPGAKYHIDTEVGLAQTYG